jgi:predicted metal-dependent HD superfamily phosphohydrolase
MWKQLTAFSKKEAIKAALWNDILDHYTEPYRFYHNIQHVAELFSWSERYLPQIEQPAVLGFAILYHDVVYDTFKDNNEEESAKLAREHLTTLLVKPAIIDKVESLILATKNHSLITNNGEAKDMALFLDFDLAMLGAEWDVYEEYSHKIRKEYRQYPDVVYNPGRKHALEKLMDSAQLYYTPEMDEMLGQKARNNMFREVQLLS